ncbi:MAG: PSD1 and planctomycete cytochrome C domain-containing protein [Gemmataceae bacterium]|nr:PSD1 and planctomycete cytochrome C domain-containing protein [Gemmataceae bacterium]
MRIAATALLAAMLLPAWGRAQNATPRVDFNRQVRPILAEYCFNCHGPDDKGRKAKLRFDTRDGALAELRSGDHAIVPGKASDSVLIERVTAKSARQVMPPPKTGKKLSPQQIATLRDWINQGADWAPHWSYVPPTRPAVPQLADASWARNPIDRFILRRLREHGLEPSPEADRITLARRLYLDLTGLPPTPAEVDAFTSDTRPGAYERLVERLLASPHHGERLAMYWLDLVRYADTVGYHGDQEHHISPYRDWVIDAFNANMPFDRFTVEQLAGDLLPGATVDQKIASGYNRVLQTTHEGGAQDGEYRVKYAADRVRNLAGVWLGATVGCSECHNHKYDPYTQKDFYRLAAFFADIEERGAFRGPDTTPTKRPPEMAVLSPSDRARAEQLKTQLDRLGEQLLAGPADVPVRVRLELAALKREHDEIQKRKRLTMVTVSTAPRVVRVLNRGDWLDQNGEIVTAAVPNFMKQAAVKGRATRLDLARWLTAPDHPQTARVFVNRLWYLFHGSGLARTLDDNGAQGEWPTHPELLDWLAVEFMSPSPPTPLPPGARGENRPPSPLGGEGWGVRGWNVRHIVRLLVMSSTYRQASLPTEQHRKIDPENRFFGRQARLRLPAEMVRDNALAVSGLLVRGLGGRPAKPYQPDGYYAHLNFPKRTYKHDSGPQQYRRGVYTHWQRQFLHPMLLAFDAPMREECTAQRIVSNTPLQALALLNDPSLIEAARVFAGRILREGGTTDTERVRWAWRTVLSRAPQERETAALSRLYQLNRQQYEADPAAARRLLGVGLTAQPADLDPVEAAAWTAVARALFNLNETITRS